MFLLYTVPMKTAQHNTRHTAFDSARHDSNASAANPDPASEISSKAKPRSSIHLKRLFLVGIALVFSLSFSLSAVQSASPPSPNSIYAPQSPFPDPMHGMDDISRQQFARQQKEREIQRQKQLTSDSAKLLALANELKSEFDKTGTTEPTPEQQHKLEQIEKLAHSVRDKMRADDSPGIPMAPGHHNSPVYHN
jgi:hypothetical protein